MNKKEMTARKSSVGADERQSLNVSKNSISKKVSKINNLETICMTELYKIKIFQKVLLVTLRNDL